MPADSDEEESGTNGCGSVLQQVGILPRLLTEISNSLASIVYYLRICTRVHMGKTRRKSHEPVEELTVEADAAEALRRSARSPAVRAARRKAALGPPAPSRTRFAEGACGTHFNDMFSLHGMLVP